MNPRKAYAQIEYNIMCINELLKECEDIAKEHRFEFRQENMTKDSTNFNEILDKMINNAYKMGSWLPSDGCEW